MSLLSSAVSALLRWLNAFLPGYRQDWGEAVWSEGADVAPGWARVRWYAGGLRVVARDAAVGRLLACTLIASGAAALQVWLNWGSGPADPGVVANRAAHVP